MPKIFELFGFPIGINTAEALQHRKEAKCPFMGCKCDGGGNRYLSEIDLGKNAELKAFFGNLDRVPSGVCSIQAKTSEAPWVVCPRRLMVMGRRDTSFSHAHQNRVEEKILSVSGFPKGSKLGIWPEVKMQLSEATQEEEADKTFHYSFDYVMMSLGRVSELEIEALLGGNWKTWKKSLLNAGYAIARRGDLDYVEDFPIGKPLVIEIMTASTSGGNKNKRTTIPQAFEDAILSKPHNAPGINKRQVWARMVSQLIVKSEVALNWGGHAIWLIQDNLANYITDSTALNLKRFISRHLSEVNLLDFSYDKFESNQQGIIELRTNHLYSGPISAGSTDLVPSFSDVIRTAFAPDVRELLAILARSRRVGEIIVG